MTNYDVMRKLVGAVQTVGETCTDNARFNNLTEAIAMIQPLLDDITDVAKEADSILCGAFQRMRLNTASAVARVRRCTAEAK